MGVKSPFFRAWFGDWRANDSTPVQVATERGAARGKQRNDDTGWNINVSGKVFNETKAHTQSMNITAQPYLDYINDIVKKAVLLDSYTIGKKKSGNSLMMHSFYAVADMGNGPEVLKLYVEEMNDPSSPKTGKRAYQLQNVEYQRLSAKGSGTKSLASSTSTADIRSVADLFAAVKEKDANFNPKPASKVVNEDGTPTVVYRGGRKGITAFDGERTGGGNDQYGSGFYFATDRETADTYAGEGGETLATYLNIQNPITVTGNSAWTEDGLHLSRKTIADIIKKAPGIMDVDESPMGDFYDIWSEGITEAMFTDVAEAYVGNSIFTVENDFFRGHSAAFRKAVYDMTGYDGVVKTFPSGEKFYVAWFPNQIKHATENRGTFDTETDDIRFSVQSQETASAEDIERRLQAEEKAAASLDGGAAGSVQYPGGDISDNSGRESASNISDGKASYRGDNGAETDRRGNRENGAEGQARVYRRWEELGSGGSGRVIDALKRHIRASDDYEKLYREHRQAEFMLAAIIKVDTER